MKKMFFLLCVTIVALTALVSCDKDEYFSADAHACCFKIVDAQHINIFDQYGILIEENKENEVKVWPQYEMILNRSVPLAPDEGENLSHYLIINDGIMRESFIESFSYNHFTNVLRIDGLFLKTTDALNQEFDLVCLTRLLMRAKIDVQEQEYVPYFFQRLEINYEVVASDTLVIATATQRVIVTNNPDYILTHL